MAFAAIGTARRYGAVLAGDVGPILEQLAVLELGTESIGLKSGCGDRGIPTGKEAEQLVFADFGDGNKLRAGRWTAAESLSDGADGLEDDLLVNGEFDGGFDLGLVQSTDRILHCSGIQEESA